MYDVLLGLFLFVCIALVGIILVQQGKGASMGASFGSGASNTVFGASGSGNFLTKTTTILAALFFALALAIGYMSAHRSKEAGLITKTPSATEVSAKADELKQEVNAAETSPITIKKDGAVLPVKKASDKSATTKPALKKKEKDETTQPVKEDVK